MSERQVFFNGDFIPESQARLSIFNGGIMFGSTIFEMTRTFNKMQFELSAHLNRLYAGLKVLEIDRQGRIRLSMKEVDASAPASDMPQSQSQSQ